MLLNTKTMQAINTFWRLLLGWKSHTLESQLSTCSSVKGSEQWKRAIWVSKCFSWHLFSPFVSGQLRNGWTATLLTFHTTILSKAETVSGTKKNIWYISYLHCNFVAANENHFIKCKNCQDSFKSCLPSYILLSKCVRSQHFYLMWGIQTG